MRRRGSPGRRALARFAEDTYLHQVVARSDRGLVRHVDLPDALASAATGEWRIHFHVPVFLRTMGDLETTQPDLETVLDLVKNRADAPCLEVETYTWDVLPPEYRTAGMSEAIARELAWTRGGWKRDDQADRAGGQAIASARYLLLARISNLPTVWTNVLAAYVVAGASRESLPVASIAVVAVLRCRHVPQRRVRRAFRRAVARRSADPERRRHADRSVLDRLRPDAGRRIAVVVLPHPAAGAGVGIALAAAIVFYDYQHKGQCVRPRRDGRMPGAGLLHRRGRRHRSPSDAGRRCGDRDVGLHHRADVDREDAWPWASRAPAAGRHLLRGCGDDRDCGRAATGAGGCDRIHPDAGIPARRPGHLVEQVIEDHVAHLG